VICMTENRWESFQSEKEDLILKTCPKCHKPLKCYLYKEKTSGDYMDFMICENLVEYLVCEDCEYAEDVTR